MRRLTYWIAAVLVTAFFISGTLCAAQPDPAYLSQLMQWSSLVSGLPRAEPPPISIGPTGRLGPPSMSIPKTIPLHTKADHGGIAAITTPWGISLASDWRQDDSEDDCILKHEMVHWLQFRSGKHYACTPEMERMAYAAQQVCHAQKGEDFWRVTGHTPVELAHMMECGR